MVPVWTRGVAAVGHEAHVAVVREAPLQDGVVQTFQVLHSQQDLADSFCRGSFWNGEIPENILIITPYFLIGIFDIIANVSLESLTH